MGLDRGDQPCVDGHTGLSAGGEVGGEPICQGWLEVLTICERISDGESQGFARRRKRLVDLPPREM